MIKKEGLQDELQVCVEGSGKSTTQSQLSMVSTNLKSMTIQPALHVVFGASYTQHTRASARKCEDADKPEFFHPPNHVSLPPLDLLQAQKACTNPRETTLTTNLHYPMVPKTSTMTTTLRQFSGNPRPPTPLLSSLPAQLRCNNQLGCLLDDNMRPRSDPN